MIVTFNKLYLKELYETYICDILELSNHYE